MSDSLIERVARAMHAKWFEIRPGDFGQAAWEEMPESWRHETMEFARAAIEAMREPTEAMLNAKYGPENYERVSGWLDSLDAETVWQAMIDVALEEQK